MTWDRAQAKAAPGPWAKRALCNGLSSDLFFPDTRESSTGGTVATAKAICAACPVRSDCLEYALAPPMERCGIWAGCSVRDLDRIRKERMAARTA